MRRSISHLYPQVSALLVLTASLACSCVTAFAGEVGLAWDAHTAPEIVGYKIYYGFVSTGEVRNIDVGNVTTYRVTGLDPDTYNLCVTAYDLPGNETACSNVVSITLSPPMYGFRVESTSSLGIGDKLTTSILNNDSGRITPCSFDLTRSLPHQFGLTDSVVSADFGTGKGVSRRATASRLA